MKESNDNVMTRDAIDFGTMKIGRLFRKMFIPTVLGMLFSSLFIVTDGIFVGLGIGSEALAAINIASPLWLLSSGLGLMFGVGGSVVASIQLSRGKVKVARINMSQALVSCLLVVALLSVSCIIWADEIVTAMGCSGTLKEGAMTYLRWFMPFMPTNVLLSMGLFFLRVDGAPRKAMACNVIASVANVIFDYLFILHFQWGLKGAAVASSLGSIIGAVMVLLYIFNKKNKLSFYPIKLSNHSMILMYRNVRYMLKLGFSAFLCEMALGAMMFTGNIVFLEHLTEDGVAAFSVACYVIPIMFMVYEAIAQSAQPIISFNHGLGVRTRVIRAFLLSVAVSIVCGVFFALMLTKCNFLIVGMFINAGENAYKMAVDGLPYFSLGLIPFAFNIVVTGYYQSIDKATKATIITVLRGFVLLIPAFYYMPELMGWKGIWLAMPIAEGLTAVYVVTASLLGRNNAKRG